MLAPTRDELRGSHQSAIEQIMSPPLSRGSRRRAGRRDGKNRSNKNATDEVGRVVPRPLLLHVRPVHCDHLDRRGGSEGRQDRRRSSSTVQSAADPEEIGGGGGKEEEEDGGSDSSTGTAGTYFELPATLGRVNLASIWRNKRRGPSPSSFRCSRRCYRGCLKRHLMSLSRNVVEYNSDGAPVVVAGKNRELVQITTYYCCNNGSDDDNEGGEGSRNITTGTGTANRREPPRPDKRSRRSRRILSSSRLSIGPPPAGLEYGCNRPRVGDGGGTSEGAIWMQFDVRVVIPSPPSLPPPPLGSSEKANGSSVLAGGDDDDDDDDDGDDGEELPHLSSLLHSQEWLTSGVNAQSCVNKRRAADADEDELEEERVVARKSKKSRSRTAKKRYLQLDNDSEDAGEEDGFELPARPAKRRAPRNEGKGSTATGTSASSLRLYHQDGEESSPRGKDASPTLSPSRPLPLLGKMRSTTGSVAGGERLCQRDRARAASAATHPRASPNRSDDEAPHAPDRSKMPIVTPRMIPFAGSSRRRRTAVATALFTGRRGNATARATSQETLEAGLSRSTPLATNAAKRARVAQHIGDPTDSANPPVDRAVEPDTCTPKNGGCSSDHVTSLLYTQGGSPGVKLSDATPVQRKLDFGLQSSRIKGRKARCGVICARTDAMATGGNSSSPPRRSTDFLESRETGSGGTLGSHNINNSSSGGDSSSSSSGIHSQQPYDLQASQRFLSLAESMQSPSSSSSSSNAASAPMLEATQFLQLHKSATVGADTNAPSHGTLQGALTVSDCQTIKLDEWRARQRNARLGSFHRSMIDLIVAKRERGDDPEWLPPLLRDE